MANPHMNGSALKAWLEVATANLPAELAARAQEEIRLHVYAAQGEAIARGVDPAEAYREALESLGDAQEVNRMYRDLTIEDFCDGAAGPGEATLTRRSDMNRPRLEWTSAEGQALTFPLSSGEVTIGRKEKSDLVIRHPNASRFHAKLVEVHGGYELVDLDSHFGTYVNGERIERRRLHAGDKIRIARDAAELSYL